MNKTTAVLDAIEARLALVVIVGAAAFSAADPTALSPKWAAILAASVAVAKVLPGAGAAVVAPAVEAPAPLAAPTEAQVNAELP